MVSLFPRNPDPSRFGNKYKSLLACVATGFKVYGNRLQGFEELLDSDAIAPPGTKGYDYGSWRLPVIKMEESLLTPAFQDKYPERFDTDSWEVESMYSRRFTIDGFYHKIPKPILNRLIRATEWIPWKPQIQQHLQSIPLLHRVLGVSVRTWRAPHDTCALSAHRAKQFKPEKYLEVIKKFENKVEAIFFSFDNPEAEKYFKDVTIPRINIPLTQFSPLVQAATKAQILGNCGLILGDKESTFIEAAWYMGGCRADVILIS